MKDKITPASARDLADLFDDAAWEVTRLRDLAWSADQTLQQHQDLTITREETCGRVCTLLRIIQERAELLSDKLEGQRHKLATKT